MRPRLRLVAGNVVTLQLNLQFLASAKGDRFEARARVTKAGKAQLFAAADLIAWREGAEALAASASAVLAKVG
jgi:acyl-coenzyme A thioesterase PaaI-like protein